VDVAIRSVVVHEDSTLITLERVGKLPLPVDVQITDATGNVTDHHIPQVVTQGHRPLAEGETGHATWPWTHPTYTLALPRSLPGCTVEVDAAKLTADADRSNNRVELSSGVLQEWRSEGDDR
jgi:hypothetical protein